MSNTTNSIFSFRVRVILFFLFGCINTYFFGDSSLNFYHTSDIISIDQGSHFENAPDSFGFSNLFSDLVIEIEENEEEETNHKELIPSSLFEVTNFSDINRLSSRLLINRPASIDSHLIFKRYLQYHSLTFYG